MRGIGLCLATLLASWLAAPALAELQLSDAWVRALPPTQSSTAGYLTAVNKGASPVTLASVSASAAGRTEIHRTRNVDGLVRMERVGELTLAPGQRLELSPGGMHLMLMDLPRMPAEGETVTLCLHPAQGEVQCIDAPVRRSGAAGHGQHMHH